MNTSLNVKFVIIPLLFIIFIMLFSLNTASAVTDIYVNVTSGNDSWDGTNPIHTSGLIGPKKTIKNGVAVVSEGGTVNIAKGTYNENNISISKNLNLQGESQSNTIIDAQKKNRVFTIFSGNTVTITDLSFINGLINGNGGAIMSFADTLTINNCKFINNTATYANGGGGAVYKYGGNGAVNDCTFITNKAVNGGGGALLIDHCTSFNVDNCVFTSNTATGNGGAVLNYYSSSNVNTCSFTNNVATTGGGGILNHRGSLTVTESTFTNNTVSNGGGGAIYNYYGTLTDTKNTFSKNKGTTDGGALLNSHGTLDVFNSGFSGNLAASGGAISNSYGTLTANQSLFSGNTATNGRGGGVDNFYGTFMSNNNYFSYNLASNGNGAAISNTGTLNIADTQFINNVASVDGGAVSSLTNPLTVFNCTFTDNSASNRGGAILNIQGIFTVTKSIFTTNKATSGSGGAIYTSGASGNINTGTFNRNTAINGGAVYSYQTDLIISESLFTINGAANGNGGAISISLGNVNLVKNNFTGNTGQAGGSVVNSNSNLTVSESRFISNRATNGNGGAIYNYYGTLIGNKTIFTSNVATNGNGGAVSSTGTSIVANSTLTSNTATIGGGAIFSIYNPLTVTNCTFNNNSAIARGGAISSTQSILTVTKSSFSGNNATNGIAGAVYSSGPNGQINESTFVNNKASDHGGAASNYGSSSIVNDYKMVINNCSFTNNTASSGYGGAVYNHDGNLTITNSVLNNNAAFTGGSIFNDAILRIDTCTFTNNSATSGTGGAVYNYFGNMAMNIVNFTTNKASNGNGGAIYLEYGSLIITWSTFLSNTASNGNGGAIYNSQGSLTPMRCTFSGNVASNGNGGAIVNEGYMKATNSNFINNVVINGNGGGIYNMGTGLVQFNRIVSNGVHDIFSTKGSLDARFNWWGLNSNPSSRVSGAVTVGPWMILKITSNPVTISTGSKSTITADLRYDSNGVFHDPTSGQVPDGITATFNTTDSPVLGTFSPVTSYISKGVALSTFTAIKSGTAHLTGKIDNQFLSTLLTILNTNPTVVSSDPVNDAVNVPINKVIKVTFNEPVLWGTWWIELKNSSGALIPISKSITSNVLTITASSLLAAGTRYTIQLHTGCVKDYDGNPLAGTAISFTTDAIAPTVVSSDPVNNAVNVPRNKVIKVTFNEPVLWGTWWIELKNSSGALIPISKSITSNVLTITASSLLAAGTRYTIQLHTGCVKDYAGNPLAGTVISFTTGST